IATGVEEQVPWLHRFYFGGDDDPGLKEKVSSRLSDIDARLVNSIPLGNDANGVELEVRVGRYGPPVQRGDDSASVPDGTAPDELTVERALELLAAGRDERVLGTDPVTGLTVVARTGRYGPYVQLGLGEEVPDKPKFASLFKTMVLETVTLEDALQLLSLPRTVGADPADGVEITVQNGRYGPFVRKGSDSRSLPSEDKLFTVTLEECLKLLAQPKSRGRQAPAAPLRELGEDPDTGRAVVVKDGRYGHYVTDGETNASLRSGDTVEGLTLERACELLAERRAKGPAKKRPARRRSTGKRK
ncbi:MAG: DNA topoisomerase I, partial [Acidimicrobiaceae bacterium]|nr:DNA topoisomerase I [Acidimicrobiaceae bacterium]